MPVTLEFGVYCSVYLQDEPAMASKMAILRGRYRLCRARPGSVFLFLLGVACVLCVLNWFSNSYMKQQTSSLLDFDGGGRRLAGLPGGDHLIAAYRGHRRRKRPPIDAEELQVCEVPKLSLDTDTNRHAYYDVGNLTCPGSHLFYIEDSVLRVNRTVLDGTKLSHCIIRCIDRISDAYHTYSRPMKRTGDFEVKVKNDFFRVECYTAESVKREDDAIGGKFDDYQRRRLLQLKDPNEGRKFRKQNGMSELKQDESEMSKHFQHSPKLYGSMGLPDLPDSMLHQEKHHEQLAQNRTGTRRKSENSQLMLGEVKDVLRARQDKHGQADVQPKEDQPQQGKRLIDHSQQDRSKSQQQAVASQNDNSDKLETRRLHKARSEIKDKLAEINSIQNQNHSPDEIQFDPHKDYEENLVFDYEWDNYVPDFDQFFAQVFPKADVKERISRLKPFVNSTQMNVLIFTLDSMSHLSYQRKLPMTYAYLRDTLNSVILDAYNIVGDATTAAIIPMLTGKTETELPEARVNKEGTHYVDIYPFIWNKFEQSGYVTMYAEDEPSLGTFQLRLNGFEESPVDHYMRPFWQAVWDSELNHNSPRFCLGGNPKHKYTLDYVKDLFVKYPSVPKFAFAFLVELSHANNNPAQYVDADLRNLLEFLRTNGHLDNTLLIVMSDHGARYSKVRQTTQGKLEERLPMMALTLPEKFQTQYPHLMRNLKSNRRRLSTPFDLHETLQTVLNVYNGERPIKYTDRGISLLNTIPANRTCQSAGIALHWCTCMQYEYLDVTDRKIKNLAEYAISYINTKLQVVQDLCSELTLKTIHEARIVYPNEKVLKFLRSKDSDQRIANFSQTIKLDILHYQLTMETSPNDGLYETTIQAIVADGTLSIVGDISRINQYSDQPHCILNKHPDLAKYCLCKEEPTPTRAKSHRKTKKSQRGKHL